MTFMKNFTLSVLTVLLGLSMAWAQEPVVHWRFANPVTYEDQGMCYFQFDVELSCDMAGTFHSDMQVYFNYNDLAFGQNIVLNNNVTHERLELMLGDVGGTNMYVIYGPQDNKPFRYAILTEKVFPIANPMFMNEVPMYPTFGGFFQFTIMVQDQNELAGVEFVPSDGGIGIMDGGQYYLDATHPSATKYGVPPEYAGVYENDLLTEPVMCGPQVNEWTGAFDDNWFEDLNWSMGAVPAGEDVMIPDVSGKAPFPVIFNGSASVGMMTIAPMASVVIDFDGDLTAGGMVTNDGLIQILSNDQGNSGSFIDNGGVMGTGDFEFIRNITSMTAPAGDPTGWHYLSSPVDGFETWDLFDYFVNYWDEPNDMWVHVEGGEPCVPGPNLPMGPVDAWSVKYDVAYYCDPPNTAQGMDINMMGAMADYRNGSYTAALGYTAGNAWAGWNMVGNPYAASVDPALLTWGPNVNQSVYYWDGWSNTYESWAGGVGSLIPPTQGFFVSTTAADQVDLAPGARVHNTAQWWWKNEISNLLKLKAEGNGYADGTYIRFHDDATASFDKVWDAYKLMSDVPEVPQIYTSLNGTNYSINAVEGADMMPLSFTAGVSGSYTIAIEENNDFDVVYLEDLKTGVLHNLETAYEFSYVEGENADRFVIHFGQISMDNAQNGLVVYSNQNNVYVYNANNLRGDVQIYSVMGQLVTSVSLEDGMNVIGLNDVNTYYVVKVLTDNTVVSEKVYIK